MTIHTPLPAEVVPVETVAGRPEGPAFWATRLPVYTFNKIVGSYPCDNPADYDPIMFKGYVSGWRRKGLLPLRHPSEDRVS